MIYWLCFIFLILFTRETEKKNYELLMQKYLIFGLLILIFYIFFFVVVAKLTREALRQRHEGHQ